MKHLALSFFGAFQTTLGGTPITNFRSVKIQGLLVYLALTPQLVHERQSLGALFWPDEPEATAKRNLRQSLHRLRHLLGDTNAQDHPFLLVTRSTVQLNPASDHSVDVAGFLAALETDQLETCRGPLSRRTPAHLHL